MKNFYTVLAFLLLTVTTIAQSNKVIVKGYVTYANGTAAPNRIVTVSDSVAGNTACMQTHQRTTNSNGFYSDTLSCSNAFITRVRVYTADCNTGVAIIHELQVPATGIVESNFSLSCNSTIAGCEAVFTASVGTASNVAFNSSSSHGGNASDSVIRRKWQFGDGDSSDAVNPVHTYSQPGTYQACLIIWTASGCVTYTCKSITIAPVSSGNKVIVKGYVTYANGNAVANQVVYIMVDSNAAHNGSCAQSHAVHTNANGYYSDTLTCTSSNITAVGVTVADCNGAAINHHHVVPSSNIVESNFSICLTSTCHASFTRTINNLQVFVTSTSAVSSGNINNYIWNFGDGTASVTTNAPNASHTYAANGTYAITLRIIGTNNCSDTAVEHVTLFNATGCHATFRDSIAGNLGFFFSGGSTAVAGDSIIGRIWSFGDGSSSTAINPDHHYQTGGVYTVCLTIKSSRGCYDSVCKAITIVAQAPACTPYFIMTGSATNYKNILFNSTNSTAGAGDVIISRTWNFGDGSTLTGNAVSPDHTYQQDGVYNVCLRIVTSMGCTKDICKTIEIKNRHCVASYVFSALPATLGGYPVKFNSSASTAPAPDSIRERIWLFGDGTTAGGTNIDPTHTYAPGTYNVCLVIRTTGGCSDTTCKTITVPLQGQVYCAVNFSFVLNANRGVQFNSSASSTSPGDSIVTRIWNFGDGTSLAGNNVSPAHTYAQAGVYNVCLHIITARGCDKTECKQVVAAATSTNCIARFEFTRTAPKRVQFNSSMSWTAANDSIIERKWTFGDGSPVLGGNVVSPLKDYVNNGIYTVCLKIKTATGCESSYCASVRVGDSGVNTYNDPILIVQTYPSPATTQLNTVVWSLHNNVTAELAIFDIYGVKKWSISKLLLQGNNYTVLPVAQLLSGPYFFRVTTMYGVKSRQFYKL
jgi:PKD repeat protein